MSGESNNGTSRYVDETLQWLRQAVVQIQESLRSIQNEIVRHEATRETVASLKSEVERLKQRQSDDEKAQALSEQWQRWVTAGITLGVSGVTSIVVSVIAFWARG